MGKNPAIQFYIGDWKKDPQLSMCKPATRGIWMDLLCAMHESGRTGVISGTIDQLSKVCRCTTEEFKDCIRDLKRTKTANVTVGNAQCNAIVTLINRRMRREHKERQLTKKRVVRHRGKKDDKIFNGDVTEKKRSCNGNVTLSTSSSKDSSSLKEKNKEKKCSFLSDDLSLANLLSELMTGNNPSRKLTTESELNSWANECRLMRERDKRTNDDIEGHIRFSQEDTFWKQNILSMGKLRKQYDKLTLKMKGKGDDRSAFKSRISSYGDGEPFPVDIE